MINAKQETIDFLRQVSTTYGTQPKCAIIWLSTNESDKKSLKIGYTQNDYENWLTSIDMNYNPSIGEQLIGNIWFEDGYWGDRFGECNAQNLPEWWGVMKCPAIPQILT